MTRTREEVLADALRLPVADRLTIAHELLDTLPDELEGRSTDDPEFHAELERRSADRAGSVPWEQLRDELRGR